MGVTAAGSVFNLGALVVGIESVVDGGDFYTEELIVETNPSEGWFLIFRWRQCEMNSVRWIKNRWWL